MSRLGKEEEDWLYDAMQEINRLTPDIKEKAFSPDWFLLRQRFEQKLEQFSAIRAELKQAQEQIDTLLADCQAHGSHIRELQAELKQAEFDIARKARAIIALNESYKALRDGLEPKLADITGKRNAAESRAEEAERSAEAMSEKVKSLAPHGTCGCSYDKPGNVCMHHSPQLVKAEQRLARVKEIVAIGVNALEHCDRRHKKCNCSKEALAEIAAALKELEGR